MRSAHRLLRTVNSNVSTERSAIYQDETGLLDLAILPNLRRIRS
jgi:hypothetical protein